MRLGTAYRIPSKTSHASQPCIPSTKKRRMRHMRSGSTRVQIRDRAAHCLRRSRPRGEAVRTGFGSFRVWASPRRIGDASCGSSSTATLGTAPGVHRSAACGRRPPGGLVIAHPPLPADVLGGLVYSRQVHDEQPANELRSRVRLDRTNADEERCGHFLVRIALARRGRQPGARWR